MCLYKLSMTNFDRVPYHLLQDSLPLPRPMLPTLDVATQDTQDSGCQALSPATQPVRHAYNLQ